MGTLEPGGKGLPLAAQLIPDLRERPSGQGPTLRLSVPLFAHLHNGCASSPPTWAEEQTSCAVPLSISSEAHSQGWQEGLRVIAREGLLDSRVEGAVHLLSPPYSLCPQPCFPVTISSTWLSSFYGWETEAQACEPYSLLRGCPSRLQETEIQRQPRGDGEDF